MTDDHPDPLDELASAHLDGLTSADEDERIAADPDLQQRIAALDAVRDALREPPPAFPASVRDAAIAAAVAQAGPTDDLAPARTRRASRRPLGRRALGIAAALVLLALALPLLAGLDGSGDDETASVATRDAGEATGDGSDALREGRAQDRAEGGGAAAEDAGAPYRASGRVADPAEARAHLGSFSDLDELEAALRDRAGEQRLLSGPSPATSGAGESARSDLCEVPDELEPGSAVVLAAPAVVGDREVVVAVVEAPDGRRSIQVVTARPPCELVAEGPLEG